MSKQKGVAPILIIILLAALVLGGFLIYQNLLKTTALTPSIAGPVGILMLDKIKQGQLTPTPHSTPLPITDETANPDLIGANWKIYTGRHFSFKYPSGWFLAEEKPWRTEDLSPVVKLSPVKTNGQLIFVIANKLNGLSLDQFIEEKRGIDPKIFKPVTIGKIEGKTASYATAFNSEFTFVNYTGSVIEVLWVKSPGEKIKKLTFDQILSTFKFTQ